MYKFDIIYQNVNEVGHWSRKKNYISYGNIENLQESKDITDER